MEEKKEETFCDRLCSSKFAYNLTLAICPIVATHLKTALDEGKDYNSLGTANEKKLKSILGLFSNLKTVVEDIEKVFVFLRYEAITPLKELYPLLDKEEDYYKYHLENYFIRIAMIPDALVKIGNFVNPWGLSTNCYGTTLLDSKKNANVEQEAIDLMQKLIDKIKEIRDLRNNKIHVGVTEIPYLSDIVWWNDFEIPGMSRDELLVGWDEQKKKRQFDDLEKSVFEVIDIVKDFLDLMAEKVNDLVEQ